MENNRRLEIVLTLGYNRYPIPDYDTLNNIIKTGIKVIDNDQIINKLNYEIGNEFQKYFIYDGKSYPFYFNQSKCQKEEKELIVKIKELIGRLHEINDGSYIVRDKISDLYDCQPKAKEEIRLMLEFLTGAILASSCDDGIPCTEIEAINNDPIVIENNFKIGDKFSDYYEFDSHDQGCWFNEEQFNKDKPFLKDCSEKLIRRLIELYDGNFVLLDQLTEDLKLENDKKYKLVLVLDYLKNPIKDSTFDKGILFTDIKVIDNDKIVKKLNSSIGKKYSSYFEFNTHDMPCYFNKEKLKIDKEYLIECTNKLIHRLNEINNGSYEVIDEITNHLKKI